MKKLKSIIGFIGAVVLLLGFGYILREFMRFPAETLRFNERSYW